ncbi:FAD-dependent monooxygenase [Nocardia sp. NPDC049190]|uniref:FAD-dependent monooxygenase n=1 Tax=Nocardia sp. NPDC049190 TaxID=3155650 RepID=UPI00340F13BE
MNTTQTNSCEFDCLILGAGVGGALLALLLGRQGRRVLVISNKPKSATRGAEILKPRGIRILAEHGLLSELVSRGAMEREVIDFHHDGSLLLSYDFAQHTMLGHFLIVPYAATVGTILDACAELPNVDIRFNRRMVEAHTANSRVIGGTLDDGTVLRARALVDSSGSASPLRDYVGSEREVSKHDHILRMTTIPVTASVLSRNRMYFSSTGWFAYFYPVSTKLARVFIGLPQEQDSQVFDQRSADLSARLGEFVSRSGDALALVDASRFVRAPVSAYSSKPYHRDNVVLLGSTAFSPHPMTGQGMSYIMEDATILASILVAAQDDRDLRLLLHQRYEERRTMHTELVAYGDALARSYPDRDAYLKAHRAGLHGGDR